MLVRYMDGTRRYGERVRRKPGVCAKLCPWLKQKETLYGFAKGTLSEIAEQVERAFGVKLELPRKSMLVATIVGTRRMGSKFSFNRNGTMAIRGRGLP